MTFSLPPHLERQILDRVESGRYQSAEDVISAALSSLDQQESIGDFAPGELDRLMEEGKRSGPPIPAEKVFAKIRELSAQQRRNAVG